MFLLDLLYNTNIKYYTITRYLRVIFNTYLIDKPENKVQIPENLCDNAGEFVTNTRTPAQNSVSSGASPSFLFVMIWHDLTVGIWALVGIVLFDRQ